MLVPLSLPNEDDGEVPYEAVVGVVDSEDEELIELEPKAEDVRVSVREQSSMGTKTSS